MFDETEATPRRADAVPVPCDGDAGRRWFKTCALLVIPFTAILHNAIFDRPTCILNSYGPDYYPAIIQMWLAKDPSLPWAIVASFLTYYVGRRYNRVTIAAWPFLYASLPLSIWIWDIPFTKRIICMHMHDRRFAISGFAIRCIHLYILTLGLFLILFGLALRRRSVQPKIAGFKKNETVP